jgi:hypothetical protein
MGRATLVLAAVALLMGCGGGDKDNWQQQGGRFDRCVEREVTVDGDATRAMNDCL